MFNEYVWTIYLQGSGKDIVSFFEKNLAVEYTKEYANKICEFHQAYCASKSITSILNDELNELFKCKDKGVYLLEDGEYSISTAVDTVYNLFLEEEGSPQGAFDIFSGSISFFTTILACELPDLMFPYYFNCNFNIFEKIAQEFDIQLPNIPIKKDYKGRFLFYGKLCECLYDFRIEHNMSPYELCAFLYDFAPKYVGGVDSYIIKELPDPKGVYFIGGSKGDGFLSDEADTITPWQCNPDTMAGDLIVMYLKTPISAVDSIWRSVSVGFCDPFFFYYNCTYIAIPKKIKRISQKQMKEDMILGELPIVKKNLQGINGVELYPSVYNRLLDIAQSDLDRLEFFNDNYNDLTISREKDVENKLIKPFLNKLGYSENEYRQQLYIEIGNHNHALIPDFVIKPVVFKGHQSADFLIEAKFSITSSKLLEEAKTQARGYANLLNAKYSVIASKEGIWISSFIDDYSEDLVSLSWDELKIEDNFYRVFKIIGKKQ